PPSVEFASEDREDRGFARVRGGGRVRRRGRRRLGGRDLPGRESTGDRDGERGERRCDGDSETDRARPVHDMLRGTEQALAGPRADATVYPNDRQWETVLSVAGDRRLDHEPSLP